MFSAFDPFKQPKKTIQLNHQTLDWMQSEYGLAYAVDASYNADNIPKLDMFAANKFATFFPQLTILNLANNSIGSVGFNLFATNTTIHTLNASNNEINDIIPFSQFNTTVTALNINNPEDGEYCLDDANISALANNTIIRSLGISCHPITVETLKSFETNTTLTHLELAKHKDAAAIGAGIDALHNNSTLTTLILTRHELLDGGLQILMNSKMPLNHLGLGKNRLSQAAGSVIASSGKVILSLDLTENTLCRGISSLAKSSLPLTELSVRDNCMPDEAAEDLAANETIRSLDISENWLSDEGVKPFNKNTTITILDFIKQESTLISEEVADCVSAQVKQNKEEQEAKAKQVASNLRFFLEVKNLRHKRIKAEQEPCLLFHR